MKPLYWRWKGNQTISKSYLQKDLGNMLELAESNWQTSHPLRILKKEIDIIEPQKDIAKELE